MYRFFVNRNEIYDEKIRLSDDDLAHIRVLRIKPNESFVVCDSNGIDYICQTEKRDDEYVSIIDKRPSQGEPNVKCVIYTAYAKSGALEYIVQKSVELGAVEIVFFPTKRSPAIPDDIEKKITRYNKIALEAAKQSDRGIVPNIKFLPAYELAVNEASNADISLFLYENEEKNHIKETLERSARANSYSIVTGSEGGFTDDEAKYAQTNGMISVSLGKRILRCETAPVATLSIIMYQTGNM